MGVKIKRNASGGGYRRWWYASYRDGGRVREMRLPVRIEGRPPASLSVKDAGDARYERSKARAEREMESFLSERTRKGACETVMERLVESKTGERVSYVRIREAAERWNAWPRTRELSEGRRDWNALVAEEFARSCGREYLYEVRDSHVKAYFDDIRGRFAWSTVKSRIGILSGIFSRFLPPGCPNPFKSIMKRGSGEEAGNVHRVPLTDGQVAKVRDLARGDAFLYPLFVCALSTGARLVDVCLMRKDSVDLREGFVSYVAHKTGTRCEVPLFDEFRAVCEGIVNSSDPSEPLLFPEAAAMYENNRSGLVRRGKLLIAKALFGGRPVAADEAEVVGGAAVPEKAPAEVLALIDGHGFAPRKAERMKDAYLRYAVRRQSFRTIERETGVGRTMVSYYLREAERITGGRIVRFGTERPRRDLIAETRTRRAGARRSASAYGWSSLRATFCRLAIQRGVDQKAIMTAVGHANFSTTMTYYNNPTREHQRQAWMGKAGYDTATGGVSDAVAKPDGIGKFVDALSPEQRKAFLLELTNRMLSA